MTISETNKVMILANFDAGRNFLRWVYDFVITKTKTHLRSLVFVFENLRFRNTHTTNYIITTKRKMHLYFKYKYFFAFLGVMSFLKSIRKDTAEAMRKST